jgi:hypothetical protein
MINASHFEPNNLIVNNPEQVIQQQQQKETPKEFNPKELESWRYELAEILKEFSRQLLCQSSPSTCSFTYQQIR